MKTQRKRRRFWQFQWSIFIIPVSLKTHYDIKTRSLRSVLYPELNIFIIFNEHKPVSFKNVTTRIVKSFQLVLKLTFWCLKTLFNNLGLVYGPLKLVPIEIYYLCDLFIRHTQASVNWGNCIVHSSQIIEARIARCTQAA